MLLCVLIMSEEEINELRQTINLQKSKIEQLQRELDNSNAKLHATAGRIIPEWLTEKYILKKKIVLTHELPQNPSDEIVRVYYPVKMVLKYILFPREEKPRKLLAPVNYPNLYIRFGFYNSLLMKTHLCTTRFKIYQCAHNVSGGICARFKRRIESIEDLERAVMFIKGGFETWNPASMFTGTLWHKSFRQMLALANNDLKNRVPDNLKCGCCGNLYINGERCITYYIRDQTILDGCYHDVGNR